MPKADSAPAAAEPVVEPAPAPEPAKVEEPAAVEETAPAVPEAPAFAALLDHDDQNATANHAGVIIARGDNGLYLVPLSFVEALLPHGFRVVAEGKAA